MAQNKQAGIVGSASVSRARGSNDPRIRRNFQSALPTDVRVRRPFAVDSRQRLSLTLPRAPRRLSSDATLSDVIEAYNTLAADLRGD